MDWDLGFPWEAQRQMEKPQEGLLPDLLSNLNTWAGCDKKIIERQDERIS